MIDKGILALGNEAQRALTWSLQNRLGPRVAAGEQRDLVPPSNQFFRQVGHDTLCAAIELRRAALVERRNLCNPHFLMTPRFCQGPKPIGWSRVPEHAPARCRR